MGRIACILVTDFPLASLIRANPELEGALLVMVESPVPHAEVMAVAPKWRTMGIHPHMTVAQARAVAADLTITTRSPMAEHSAIAALTDVAASFSPIVEAGEPGCVWLDLAGTERLYPDEDELAAEMIRRTRRVGLEAAVGIAANCDIAHLAARCGGIRVIAPGFEREFLGWLPLDLVTAHDNELQSALTRLGIKRLGELARLAPAAIGARFGRRGVELMRLASGGDTRHLSPPRRLETFIEAIEIDYGIEHLEALGFVLRPMLERIGERLKLRGLGAGDLTITLGLEGHRRDSQKIAMTAASNDTRVMLALINLRLEAAPPSAAIESLRVEVEPRVLRPAQTELFAAPAPPPEKLQVTIARLAALCGPDHVGMLQSVDSYRPEAVGLERFNPPPAAALRPEVTAARKVMRLVIGAVRPALEVEVWCARGIPEFVRGANLGGRVVALAGPWRRDGEWWRGADGFIRDYYELALADGGIYRTFRDLTNERWFVDGIYD